jgi:hypothetical protein
MFENLNDIYPDHEPQDIRKSKKSAYLLLLGLSILSALAILSLWLIWLTNLGSGGFEGIIWIVGIIAVQWVLVIPATWIVSSIYKKLSRQRRYCEISPLVQGWLPFSLNFLAACSFLMFPLIIFFHNMILP